ncbi:MAG: PD-(D/E)XK nuclease family protein [Candidatus Cybelea sp.]
MVFIDDALTWHRTGEEVALLRMIRAPRSGVPHDAGAAYATLAARTGNLLDAIDASRLALPSSERDSLLRFARGARAIRALPLDLSNEALREAIDDAFAPLSGFDVACAERSRSAQDDKDEVELAEAQEPERATGVPGWQKHFSASALNTYSECARRWFYRYACAAIEDPGSSASAYGTAFHLALEDFHGEFPRPRNNELAKMRGRMRECITWAFERNRNGFETRVEFELQVRRAQRTAQRYIDWLLVQEREAPFEVLGREVPAEIELDGRTFIGFIDRMDRDERTGDIGVVDYKTGSIATSAAEYCEKVRRFTDFQLPFYYWARTVAGDRVTKLVLIPLKDALLDARPIVLDVAPRVGAPREKGDARGTIGLDELERSRAAMIERSGQLASGEILRFEETKNASVCTFCAYATACEYKPPPEAQRFGS